MLCCGGGLNTGQRLTIVAKSVGGASSRDVVRVSERHSNVGHAMQEGRNNRSNEGVPGAVLWEDGPQVGD